jgi:GNAT superfamily N-acetyltransferase
VADFEALLAMAREVEPLFGTMADDAGFQAALKAALADGNVLCAYGADGAALGAVVLDREQNAIAWLAVAGSNRGQGAGRALVAAALEELSPVRDVTVQTFAPGVPEGEPARRLYLAFGFKDHKTGGLNPAGVDTVFMVRPAAW